MCFAKDRYTNSRITCMQYSQKNFMRIIGNDQKNNGQNFWEILERIIGKISSIIGAGLTFGQQFSIRYFPQITVGVSREKCWEGQRGVGNYWIRFVEIILE